MSSWFIRRANITAGGGPEPTPTPRLPDTFKELAYIQSTRTQYIDTQYTPTLNSKVRVKFAIVEKNTSGYFGARKDPYRFNCTSFSSGNQFAFAVTRNSWPSAKITAALDTAYDCYAENGKHTVDGVDYTDTEVTSWGDCGTFKLCALTNTGAFYYTAAKYYLCQIWESGVLKVDLVPAMRKSDNEVGMYDLVSDTFLTNAGSGTFSYGEL